MYVLALVLVVVFAASGIYTLKANYRKGKEEEARYEEWRSTMPPEPSRYDREEE